jgi:protein-disulfide isomerase
VVFAVITSNRVNLSPRQVNIPDFSNQELADFNALGDPNAPVVIEVFSDFGCSHCGNFVRENKNLIEEEYVQTGQVYLVFHSVGDLLGSPATYQAAEAAYCAGDQEAFWPFHDLLFANQAALFTNPGADISGSMTTFAELLELDLDQFDACLTSGKYQSRLIADRDLADSSGISGTPSFLINGELLVGNQPYTVFQQTIDSALSTEEAAR